MSTALSITAATNAAQTSIIIQDYTGISRTGMTGIALLLTNDENPELNAEYVLDVTEEAAFVEDGLVEILFTKIFTTASIIDGWWSVQLTATTGDYISNIYGFTIYIDLQFAVFSLVNSVHVPETNKGRVEQLAMQVMFLKGIQYLDTSYINDRGTKILKRQNALNKMMGI